jgi:hypothetical protein
MRLTQGSPTAPRADAVRKAREKPNRGGDPEARRDQGGGRSTDSTDDPGPVKPGNGMEEKTPGTGEGRCCEEREVGEPAIYDG